MVSRRTIAIVVRAAIERSTYTRARFAYNHRRRSLSVRARPVTHIFNRCQPDRKPGAMCSTSRRLATTDRRRAFFFFYHYYYSDFHVLRSPTGVSRHAVVSPAIGDAKRNSFLFTLSTLFRFVTPRFVRPSGGPRSKENSGQQQKKIQNETPVRKKKEKKTARVWC